MFELAIIDTSILGNPYFITLVMVVLTLAAWKLLGGRTVTLGLIQFAGAIILITMLSYFPVEKGNWVQASQYAVVYLICTILLKYLVGRRMTGD